MIGEDGRVAGRGYREIPQYFPRAWLGGARRARDPRLRPPRRARGDRRGGRRSRRDRHHQPARDGRRLGARHGKAGAPRDRLAGSPHRGALRRSSRRAPSGSPSAPDSSPIRISRRRRSSGCSANAIARALRSRATWPSARSTHGSSGSSPAARVHATDPTNASRTMLFDIDRREWSDGALRAVRRADRDAARGARRRAATSAWRAANVLGADMPILGVAGDQQAALFGQGCWTRGTGKNTYGTGAFLLLNAGDDASARRRRAAHDHRVRRARARRCTRSRRRSSSPARRCSGCATDSASSRTRGKRRRSRASIASTDGVYFVPALTGLGAPNWEPDARGTIVGLTRGTGRAHLVRAALEAMATAPRMCRRRCATRAAPRSTALRVDGGATMNDWLMQFQADMLGVPVERPDMVETTALGAAGLAGLAAGVWQKRGGVSRDAALHVVRAAHAARRRARADARMAAGGARRGELGARHGEPRDDAVARAPTSRALSTHLSAVAPAAHRHGRRSCQFSHARTPRVMLVGQAPGPVEAGEEGRSPAAPARRSFAGSSGAAWMRPLPRSRVHRGDHAVLSRGEPERSRRPRAHARRAGGVRAVVERRARDHSTGVAHTRRPAGDHPISPQAPLDEFIGRAHDVEHAGGRSVAIPLPHPSGASSWIHSSTIPRLLDRALG